MYIYIYPCEHATSAPAELGGKNFNMSREK